MSKIDSIVPNNPAILLIKPIISRIIDNKLTESNSILNMVEDSNGNIDAVGILNETIDNIDSMPVFNTNIKYLGNIEIGNGHVCVGIPFTDKRVSIDSNDLRCLIETIKNS